MRSLGSARRYVWLALCALVAAGTGCTSSTSYGQCVGLNDSDRDPALVYRVDTGNVIVAAIFVETVVVPVVVALEEVYCPVARKPARPVNQDGGR